MLVKFRNTVFTICVLSSCATHNPEPNVVSSQPQDLTSCKSLLEEQITAIKVDYLRLCDLDRASCEEISSQNEDKPASDQPLVGSEYEICLHDLTEVKKLNLNILKKIILLSKQ
ncbi:MAG: hypothetical protein EOP06_03095 [Proteobacteria bacterium]|nr:MAG: hypothetical protein EOP06_03095 [Pseudomonadota bacterium]